MNHIQIFRIKSGDSIMCRFYCIAFIEFGKNVINIRVDNRSWVYVYNKKNISWKSINRSIR